MGRNNRRWHKKPQQAASDYKPPYSEDLLQMSVDGLNLSVETLEILKKGGIHTVGDIVKRRKNDMYKVQNFNKKKLFEVTNAIAPLRVDFRPEEAPKDRPPQPQERKGEKPIRAPQPQAKAERKGQEKRPQTGENPPREQREQREPREAQLDRRNAGKEQGKNKKGNGNASVDFSRIFPREKLVHSPRIEPEKDCFTKFQRAGKWGFKDENGKEVIPPIYTEALNFKEDMAAVEMNGPFGYINRENVLVIPYKYDTAGSFSEGWANVSLGEKCGYIDKTGKETVPFIYDAATAFTGEGYGRVKKDGRWGNIRKDGEVSWQ